MSDLTCRELIEFLDSYVADELDAARRAGFESHLAVCGACRDYLAEYERSIALVRALRESPERPAAEAAAPEGLILAVLAAVKRS